MKIDKLPDGYVRLTPDQGKRLYHQPTGRYYSEAVVTEDKIVQFKEAE